MMGLRQVAVVFPPQRLAQAATPEMRNTMRINPYFTALIGVLAVCCTLSAARGQESAKGRARKILLAAGVEGGLIVHLGCGDGTLTAALRADERYVVHGLDGDAADVEAAKKHVRSLQLDGVTIEHFTGDRLPLVDNLVNLAVVEEPGDVTMDEIMRVLSPNGVACLRKDGKWSNVIKPRPKDIDQWTHYLYDASGNAVAHDEAVGPPRRVQWKAGPTFARHHDVLASITSVVSAGGRVFYIIDEAPASLMHYPAKWRLAARDAFNGVLLWKRPISSWETHLRSFRSGPPQLPRRLVAVGDRVYVTLGLDKPVTAVDAKSGETVKTYEGTKGADEILCHRGLLLLVTIDAGAEENFQQAVRRGMSARSGGRSIMVVDADTGDVKWKQSGEKVAGLYPITLAAAGEKVLYRCGEEVVCAALNDGRKLWRRAAKSDAPAAPAKKPGKKPTKKPPRKRGGSSASYYAPTLVVSEKEGVVLSAFGRTMTALSLDDGKTLWSCPCTPDFHAPADVFLADGLVWAGLFATEGRDPKTGQVKRKLDITGLLTAGHHPRCYRNKATDRFVISDKRGMEYFDLRSDDHARHNWVRGSCQYGIMPCNGLVYVPPNACCCYAGAMLHGFYALAAKRGEGLGARDEGRKMLRLQRGPAFDQIPNPQSQIPNSVGWPTFRGDATRSGSTKTAVPTSLKTAWQADVGGKLTAPVVGDGKLLVASVNSGRITALDVKTGKTLWIFTAAGRVDTPPTICSVGWISNPSNERDGLEIHPTPLCLLGAKDGRVYCLRLSDGALAWRFLAAEEDRRTVVDNRLESIWPVPGNVLVIDGVAYFAAGRSPYLDGGIRLYGVDVKTGKTLYETRVVIPHEKDQSKAFIMAGVRPDVLVTDGKYIYLQQIKFDKRLVRQKDLGRHVMCHSTLADDSWFYRTFWRLGYGDEYDFPNSYIKHDLRVPFGQLLVFNDTAACGLQTHMSPGIVPSAADKSSRGCMLFGDDNRPFTPDEKSDPDSDYPRGSMKRPKAPVHHKWTANLPFQARAMVLAGENLFVAGWPDIVEPGDPYAAPEGRKGGVLWVFSAGDGKKLAEKKFPSAPVFDGMAAAGGRLYISMKNGKVVCLGGK